LTGTVVNYLGFGIYLPLWLALLFSAFAIVGVMNAINVIDGFHGLAGGVTLYILLSFALTARHLGLNEITGFISLLIAAILGFLVLNSPRGKIFLGDGGAYLLGFFIAMIGIYLAGSQEKVSPWYILAVLIYPVWEVVFSIFRKRHEGRSPLEPDPYHLHMLIYRHLTHNNPLTSVVIVSAYSPFLITATLLHNNSRINFILVILFLLFYSFWYRYFRSLESEE
jgi:UDP-N-acetylmuramyl pentapeptide phosphotransferase/UDP-N-acetylglucosamine-1-phosphate transferase